MATKFKVVGQGAGSARAVWSVGKSFSVPLTGRLVGFLKEMSFQEQTCPSAANG